MSAAEVGRRAAAGRWRPRALHTWPSSLAGRVVLLLVGGLTLLHLGSVWIHERALFGAAAEVRVERIAGRIAAARTAVEAMPEAARDGAAHGLSVLGLDLHWVRTSPVPGGEGVPDALRPLVDALGPGAVAVWDARVGPGHTAIGAVPTRGGGWVSFSAAWIAPVGHPVDGNAFPALLAMAAGIALASILVVRWITRPLRRLADAADGLGRDLRAKPVPEDGPVEVRHAAAAFNAMQGRIARLVEDRTEALAALSHDLRTPLARLRLRTAFLPDGEMRGKTEADIAEMEAMIGRTLDYLREGRDAEPVVPADLAAILQTLASDAADAGRDVAYEGPHRAVLPLRRLAAKRALSNLLDNALVHGAEPVRLRLRDGSGRVVAEVADAGPGIPGADRPRSIAPFTQLDAARGRGGSGLGLAIAERFTAANGGALELDDAEGGGLVARLVLPRSGVAGPP